MELIFVTGNLNKFRIAHKLCELSGIDLTQLPLEIDEIQGEIPEEIIEHKAKSAYKLLNKPLVVSDDSWNMHGLNGFPGPYMKSINHWFTSQDFINLTKNLQDRRATVSQLLAHYDGTELSLFSKQSTGTITSEVRGDSDIPWRNVFMLDTDNGRSLAEIDAAGKIDSPDRVKNSPQAWSELISWIVGTHQN